MVTSSPPHAPPPPPASYCDVAESCQCACMLKIKLLSLPPTATTTAALEAPTGTSSTAHQQPTAGAEPAQNLQEPLATSEQVFLCYTHSHLSGSCKWYDIKTLQIWSSMHGCFQCKSNKAGLMMLYHAQTSGLLVLRDSGTFFTIL
jgi:hypothetical protein